MIQTWPSYLIDSQKELDEQQLASAIYPESDSLASSQLEFPNRLTEVLLAGAL